jgi:poly-gamma-glutamate system protein
MAVLRAELEARGQGPDPATDPNGSALVGLPWSGITTTLGSLPAKRSAAQPAAAALLRRLLVEAGVKAGDLVGIDSSGSFPGFAVATVIAAESLGARTLVIVSVGSSTYGANRPDFALPDILIALARAGLIAHGPDAVSAGGGEDAGQGMDPGELGAIISRAGAHGAVLLGGGGLESDLAARLAFLSERAGGGLPSLLVSIGGNLASTGEGDLLSGRSGLLHARDFPAGRAPGRGLVQAFLAKGLPVVRLIDVKELAAATGLPYDPLPWPEGPGLPPPRPRPRPLLSLALAALAFLVAAGIRRGGAGRSRAGSQG